MLITFVVDTSGSMSQKTSNGMTLLDCSKAAIEHFIKIRSKDASMRSDRFFLITSEENQVSAVKIGWKDNFNSFIQEVKNLQTKDMTNLGFSLQKAFDFLNQFRIQSSIDNYGQGRNPWFIEPAIVILLTDGSSLTSNTSIIENFTLPKNQFQLDPTSEPFRWDQRLFSIVLRFSGISVGPNQSVGGKVMSTQPLPIEPTIAPICDVTGGRCQIATNMKVMIQQIEGLMNKLQGGVVVSFEPLPTLLQSPPTPPPPSSLHKMLFVRSQVGFWPIPESYYPDVSSLSLPPRTAHPVIRYSIQEADTHIPENFPFDKYELEPCTLTQYLLTNKIQCTHVYMMNSLQVSGQGEPFGCLRLNSAGNSVNLFVFPYNFPRLWILLDDLTNQFKMMPSQKWKQEFESYLLSIPPYYINPLRNALKRFCTLNLIPDNIDSQFINFVNNIIKKIKSQSITKAESERVTNLKSSTIAQSNSFQQFQQKQQQDSTGVGSSGNIGSSGGIGSSTSIKKKSFHQILDQGYSSDLLSELIQQDTDIESELSSSSELSESSASTSGTSVINNNTLLRNVFDIGRNQLLGQLDKMKDHIFKKKVQKDESKHHLPISQMGNYHETISKRETLRDAIDDDKKPNTPLFGNPYRKEKQGSRFTMSIDEADEGGTMGGGIPMDTTTGGLEGGKNKFQQNKRRRFSGRGYPTSLSLKDQQLKDPEKEKEKQIQIQSSATSNLPTNSSPPTNQYQSTTSTTINTLSPSSPSSPSPPTSTDSIKTSPPTNTIPTSPILSPNVQTTTTPPPPPPPPPSPPSTTIPTSPIQTTITTRTSPPTLSVDVTMVNTSLSQSPLISSTSPRINMENNNIIKFVHKEIRKPTKDNNEIIIAQLSKLLCDNTTRLKFLKDTITLAREYKKSSLITKLMGYIDQIK